MTVADFLKTDAALTVWIARGDGCCSRGKPNGMPYAVTRTPGEHNSNMTAYWGHYGMTPDAPICETVEDVPA